jgi:hypothetical protein
MTEAITTPALRGHYTGSVPQVRTTGTAAPDGTFGDDIVWLTASLQCAEQCAANGEAFLEHQDKMKRDARRYQTETDNLRSSLQDSSRSPQDPKVAISLDALLRLQSEQTSEDIRISLSLMKRGGQSRLALTAMLDRVIQMEKSPRGADDIAPRWHSDFFDQLIEDAGKLEGDWIKKYEEALKKYMEFFDEFSKALLTKYIFEWDQDKQLQDVDFTWLREKLNALKDTFSNPETGALASFATEEEAKAFIEKLGLDGLTVRQKQDGSYAVMPNLGPVEELLNSTGKDGTQLWNISLFNAWVSGKDSIVERLRHASQVLGEKYSRNLQIYDNVIKALSSTIDAINEVDKLYSQNLL